MCCSQHEEKGAESGASAQCFSRSLNCEPVLERVCDSINPPYVVRHKYQPYYVVRQVSGYLWSETV